MMFLLLSVAPSLFTVLALLCAVPFLVARMVAAAEAPVEAEVQGGWDDLLAELDASEVDEVWAVLLDVADEVEEWNALMTMAWEAGQAAEEAAHCTVHAMAA